MVTHTGTACLYDIITFGIIIRDIAACRPQEVAYNLRLCGKLNNLAPFCNSLALSAAVNLPPVTWCAVRYLNSVADRAKPYILLWLFPSPGAHPSCLLPLRLVDRAMGCDRSLCGIVSTFFPILSNFRARLRSIRSDRAWRDAGRVESIGPMLSLCLLRSVCRFPQPARGWW